MTDFMSPADEEELLMEEQAIMMAMEEQALMLAMAQSLRESEEEAAVSASLRHHKQELFGYSSHRKPGLKANRPIRSSNRTMDDSGRTAMLDESGRTVPGMDNNSSMSIGSSSSLAHHPAGCYAAAHSTVLQDEYDNTTTYNNRDHEKDTSPPPAAARRRAANSPTSPTTSSRRRSKSPRPGWTVPPDNLTIPTEPTGGAVWSTSMINLKTDAVNEASLCVTGECVSPVSSPEGSWLSNDSSHQSHASSSIYSSDCSMTIGGGSSYHYQSTMDSSSSHSHTRSSSTMNNNSNNHHHAAMLNDSSGRSNAMTDSSRRSAMTRPSYHRRRIEYEQSARTAVSRPILIPPLEPQQQHATRTSLPLTTAAVRRVSNSSQMSHDAACSSVDSSMVAETSKEMLPQQPQPRKAKSLVSRVSQRILGSSRHSTKSSGSGSGDHKKKKSSGMWKPSIAPKMKQDSTHPSCVNLVDATGDYHDLNNTDHTTTGNTGGDHIIQEDRAFY